MKTTLLIMAAGIGSRFGGGIKQLAPVDDHGHIIMDYSIHDAIEAGFNKIVFIIRRDIEADFKEAIGNTGSFAIGDNIDAVSGATITSETVVDCVNRAVAAAQPYLDPALAVDISQMGQASGPAQNEPSVRKRAQVVKTGSGVTVISARDWAEEYPEIYASYLANNANNEVHDHVEEYPMIGVVYEGMAFNKYYGTARGHTYTVQDVTATGRPHALANCFSCKTPDFTAMVNEMGELAYTMPFADVLAQVNESVSCYNCHANTGDELVVTHTYLSDAMGEDLQKVAPETLSCAIWAEQAWSSFWTWDPKETWALITWILYAIYLHLRLRKKLSGKIMAWYVVIAVPVVLFTFVGVNTLLPGLHSYG